MDRLTERHKGIAVIKNKNKLKEAMEKLAKYEDTELSPEQIMEIDELYLEKCKQVNMLIGRNC